MSGPKIRSVYMTCFHIALSTLDNHTVGFHKCTQGFFQNISILTRHLILFGYIFDMISRCESLNFSYYLIPVQKNVGKDFYPYGTFNQISNSVNYQITPM
jgi:hypothetical protein